MLDGKIENNVRSWLLVTRFILDAVNWTNCTIFGKRIAFNFGKSSKNRKYKTVRAAKCVISDLLCAVEMIDCFYCHFLVIVHLLLLQFSWWAAGVVLLNSWEIFHMIYTTKQTDTNIGTRQWTELVCVCVWASEQ